VLHRNGSQRVPASEREEVTSAAMGPLTALMRPPLGGRATIEWLLGGAIPSVDLGAARHGGIADTTSSGGAHLPAQRPVKRRQPWRGPSAQRQATP
jgi:hypothetical protein